MSKVPNPFKGYHTIEVIFPADAAAMSSWDFERIHELDAIMRELTLRHDAECFCCGGKLPKPERVAALVVIKPWAKRGRAKGGALCAKCGNNERAEIFSMIERAWSVQRVPAGSA